MKYYRETYDNIVKELNKLETSKENMIYICDDLSSKYNVLADEYNIKKKKIEYGYQKESNILFKSVFMIILSSSVLLTIFLLFCDVNPSVLLATAEVGTVFCMLVNCIRYHGMTNIIKKEENTLKKEYESNLDELNSKLNLISKKIDKLDLDISSKKQELISLIKECGKLYMNLSEDEVDYKEDAKEEIKPYIRKKKFNGK